MSYYILISNMRETNLLQLANGQKPNSRITRGNSNLPKQEPKDISLQSSQNQEQSKNQSSSPKEKKIHHMTLKALERQKRMAQQGVDNPKADQGQVSKVPKKRGRPKGVIMKKKVEKQDFQVNLNAIIEENSEEPKKKKQLRKRQNIKKIIDPESEQIMVPQQGQLSKKEPPVKPEPSIKKAEQKKSVSANVNEPKKRGRKKKVTVQLTIPIDNLPINSQPQPSLKVFTIPKCQTYDNYNKFYNRILEQTKQPALKQQAILIFDKFANTQAYEKLLNTLK